MSEASLQDLVCRFVVNFLKHPHKQGVNPPARRWHVVRSEGFIRAFPGQRLADLSQDEVSAYL
jgi:hypothetical protein